MSAQGFRILRVASFLAFLSACVLADVPGRRLMPEGGVPVVTGGAGYLKEWWSHARERALLQKNSEFIDVAAGDLDGQWEGDFVDPSANTVKHICLSEGCRRQFPKGKFTMTIGEGGTMIEWRDEEPGGFPENPAECEADGIANVERPSGFETVKGVITSYSEDRLLVSVSPKDFVHNAGSGSTTREGLIERDPFDWCIKFGVFVSKGKVKGVLRLFEDDFRGTREGWLELKRSGENFECFEGKVGAKECEYELEDPENVRIKRSEVVDLQCISGACLNIVNNV